MEKKNTSPLFATSFFCAKLLRSVLHGNPQIAYSRILDRRTVDMKMKDARSDKSGKFTLLQRALQERLIALTVL